MAAFRTETDILADPETTESMRLRIEADRYGRALFDGLRRHHRRLHLPDPILPTWDEMNSFDRGSIWRPAIYDMLAAMGVQQHGGCNG